MKRASDYERLAQCIVCWRDPDTCECTEKDEDERGLCRKFFGGRSYKSWLEDETLHTLTDLPKNMT